MKNRTMLVTLFSLIFLASCADTMESGQNPAKGSQESTPNPTAKQKQDLATRQHKADRVAEFSPMKIWNVYVRKLIGKEEGDLTTSDVESVDALYLGNKDISTISGIEHFTNLRILHLNETQINDISALAGLTQLEYLDISRPESDDLTALTDLAKLKTLYLNNNQLEDITALAGLKQLEVLYLNDTQVVDIRPLADIDRPAVAEAA